MVAASAIQANSNRIAHVISQVRIPLFIRRQRKHNQIVTATGNDMVASSRGSPQQKFSTVEMLQPLPCFPTRQIRRATATFHAYNGCRHSLLMPTRYVRNKLNRTHYGAQMMMAGRKVSFASRGRESGPACHISKDYSG